MTDLAILTNARTADQRSMIGYGELLLDNAGRPGLAIRELRGPSLLSRVAPGSVGGRPIARDVDTLVETTIAIAAVAIVQRLVNRHESN